MTTKLAILVNPEFKPKKIRWTYKQRVAIEDGIPTIRPWRNGGPCGTEREIQKAIEELNAAMADAWSFDANGSVIP
jgi:hypothetical protein